MARSRRWQHKIIELSQGLRQVFHQWRQLETDPADTFWRRYRHKGPNRSGRPLPPVVLPQCEYASLDNRPRVRTGRLAGRCKEAREKDSRSRLGKVVDQPVKNNND
jgi:hypothetical protein